MTEIVVLAGLGVFVALAAWRLRAREGRLVAVDARLGARLEGAARARLGIPDDTPALVEFTAPHCGSCSAARAVLDEVASRHHGVRVVAADVADHLDLAREHGVMRAPTTLVIDERGRVRHRVQGVPDAGSLEAVLRPDPGRAA